MLMRLYGILCVCISLLFYGREFQTYTKVDRPSPGWIVQLVGVSSVHQKVAGSNLGQDTYLGCRLGYIRERTNLCICFSHSPLSFSLSLSLSFFSPLSNSIKTYFQVKIKTIFLRRQT